MQKKDNRQISAEMDKVMAQSTASIPSSDIILFSTLSQIQLETLKTESSPVFPRGQSLFYA